MDDLNQLLTHLGIGAGVVVLLNKYALAWLLAEKLLKAFGAKLQAGMTAIVNRLAGNPADDGVMLAFLSWRFYAALAFIVDLVIRVKLPTVASYQELIEKRKTGGGIIPVWLIAFTLGAALLCVTGCHSVDKTGVYGSGAVLAGTNAPTALQQSAGQYLTYVDAGIVDAKNLMDDFTTWELDNRASLAKTPEIRKLADNMRRNGKAWTKAAIDAREAYARTLSAADKTALDAALKVLQSAIASANALRK